MPRHEETDTVALIPLRRRDGEVAAYAIVDRADAEWLGRWRWTLRDTGYAMRGERVDGRQRNVYMHRQILDVVTGESRKVDHINGLRLDNRRTNLRLATDAQHAQNQATCAHSSRFRGVCWDASRGRWMAYGNADRRRVYLGRFDSEERAGRAAARFRAEHMPFAVEGR